MAVVGAGSAGIGVSQSLQMAMQEAGASVRQARRLIRQTDRHQAPCTPAGSRVHRRLCGQAVSNFYVFDQHGLLGKSRFNSLNEEQVPA